MRYRIIYSLKLELEPASEGSISELVRPLDRAGQSKNITPLSGKSRAIDLRVGDQIGFKDKTFKIRDIKAYRDAKTDVAPGATGDGFAYELT